MATPKQVTEPAVNTVVTRVTEPALPDTEKTRVFEQDKLVRVFDKTTGQTVRYPVPETWLDGRFPNLAEVPSSKKDGA